MNILLAPPTAFLIYMLLVALLMLIGRVLAGSASTSTDNELYASGEAPPQEPEKNVPGYRPFFVTALFFAVLHLGVVMLATSPASNIAVIYLLGLMLALITLILK